MSNHVGVQLVAPSGFEQMEAGRTYHLLRSDSRRERVLLLYFVQRPMTETKRARRAKRWTPLPTPVLVGIRRALFEHGLVSGVITKAAQQSTLPPWLAELEGKDLLGYDTIERARRSHGRARSHQDRIDTILAHIWPLVLRVDEVLGAVDPARLINAHARACVPPQNESRMRLWFYSYVVFGRQRSALHYPIHKIGQWDRFAKLHKLGRPSLAKGKQCGFSSADPEMIGRILKGFRKYSGAAERMSKIYRQSMLKIFGCQEASDERGFKHFVHPEGVPFPTLKQFSYRVIEHYGIQEVQRIMFGAARARNRLAASMGRFTESVGNLMERTEADGYWVEEVSQGYLDGTSLPGLCVVRLRCVASGMIVGIGFSLGGETGDAYRMALFCAAIGKVKFCSLFGWDIEASEWPSIGLPPHYITDRGPGSTLKGLARSEEHRPSNIELSPSWMGQSKAVVESSHPRAVQIEGKPSFKVTRMTVTQLALREVARVVRDNDSKDVSPRLNNEAVANRVRPTPLGMWGYLDSLARNDAVAMTFETAVREFLPKVDLQLKADGVYLEEQRFFSEELRASGLLDRVATSQATTISGYVFPMAARQLWVDFGGTMIEVPAMLSLRDGEDQLWISVAELHQIACLRAEAGSLFRVHRPAAEAGIDRRFEEATGQMFESRARQSGRAKRGSPKAKREAAEAKRYLRPKRGAA
jgi:hypothetical protein